MNTDLNEMKRQLEDYLDAGYKRVTYMVEGYNKKIKLKDDEYLKLTNKQIVHIMYQHDSIAYVLFSGDKYYPEWHSLKMHEWIATNLRYTKAAFIRTE